MTEQYQLVEDSQNNEWQLLRQGGENIESIFLSIDDAIKRLPDAVDATTAVVTVFDADGLRLSEHIVDRVRNSGRLKQPITVGP